MDLLGVGRRHEHLRAGVLKLLCAVGKRDDLRGANVSGKLSWDEEEEEEEERERERVSFKEFSIFPLSTKKLSLSFSRKILRVEGEDDVFAGAEVVVEGDVGDVSVGEGCFEVWRERKREGVEVEGKRGSELKLDRHGEK